MKKINKYADDIGLFFAIFTGRLFYEHFVSNQLPTCLKFILFISIYFIIYFMISSFIKGISHLIKTDD